MYFDEEERNEIENRLDIIYSLKRKYGNTIGEILDYKEEVEKEIYEIENLDEINNKLKKEQKEIEEKMLDISSKMNEIRVKRAKELSDKINKELSELEMPNARFNANVEYNEEEKFNKNGLNNVEFLISTNIGEEEKPLIKIASGGEMSRIMLAIKSVLAEIDRVPVLIFDEIDTGISGKTSKVVGEKIKNISKNYQILMITHLATIAAKGDYNYYISKDVENGKTRTKIKVLNEEETLEEIARISSGDVTEISLQHAKELRSTKKVA